MGQGLAEPGERPAQAKPGPRRRQVTIVAGPPCGGKSTFVTKNAQPGDIIVCLDTLAQQLGSQVTHNHTGSHFGRAQKAYDRLCAQVARHPSCTAWILRCAPSPLDRMELARAVRATHCVVLLPAITTCVNRARLRDLDPSVTISAISSWYSRWSAAPFDRVIRS